MIEFRWLKKRKIKSGMVSHSKVLQSRQWQVRIDASGAITPLPLPIEWTPWADVPVVDSEHLPQRSSE